MEEVKLEPNAKVVHGVSLYGKKVSTENKAYPVLVDDAGNIRIASGLPIPSHDKIELGYTGENLTSVIYKKEGVKVGELSLDYDGSKLISVELV